jgi:hypothetical protein
MVAISLPFADLGDGDGLALPCIAGRGGSAAGFVGTSAGFTHATG